MSSQSKSEIGIRVYVLTYLGLLLLTATTFGLSFASLGAWDVPVALGIAAVKSLLVALYFMHLAEQRASHRVTGITAVLLVCALVTLTVSDFLMRG